MNKIDAKFPPTIFYTKQNDCDVQNDFYFTIETNCSIQKDIPSEQKTPKIYIKGLEQLFSSESSMEAFAKSFQASSNVDDWIIKYECFRDTQELCLVAEYSLDPEASSIPENIFPVAFRSVQEKFQFTADFSKFSDKDPIGIQVYFDDFDFLSSELKDKIGPQEYTINVNEIAYILDFYAKYTKDAKDPQAPKVHAIHKGEEAEIGWDLGDVHKVSASLYDENGYQVANLPFTYNTKIDRDRKFTLSVEKDGHVETRSMTVYRTLWEKVAEVDSSSLPEGFKPDPKGNNKFFLGNNGYYIYIHPYIWISEDLINWSIFSSKITDAPENFDYYCCNYYESMDEAIICFFSKENITIIEYKFRSKAWFKYVFKDNQDKNSGRWIFGQAIKTGKDVKFFAGNDYGIEIFDIIQQSKNRYILEPTGLSISVEKDEKIISFDASFLKISPSNKGEMYCTILCNNRVYLYDIDNEYRNNIYDIERQGQNRIFLIKTNSVYMVTDSYVFELNDKEKFMDTHFSPISDLKDKTNNNIMIIGKKDDFSISSIMIKDKEFSIWNYKY